MDNSLILSLKRSSGDDGVAMDGDKKGGHEESSPDSVEKISAEWCPAFDLLVNNSERGQTEAIESKCYTKVNSNLRNHDCLNPMNDIPDTMIRIWSNRTSLFQVEATTTSFAA
ncbi:unnamed protein product [Lactuca saligna]|uniref:Uncharacterized protein n=1 Tax=Lactuca saligna TaxID=75948 RepID=A0AA35V3A2_LACSI|nr:unnamed protein product [Lactuca saligna]